MPRKFALTWQPGTNGRPGRWRKKFQGKVHYFAGGSGKYDQAAYQAAFREWESIKVKLEANAPRKYQAEYEAVIAKWEQVLAWSARHGDRENAAIAQDKLEDLRRRLNDPVLKRLEHGDRFADRFHIPTIELPDNIAELGAAAAAKMCNGVVPLPRLGDFSKPQIEESRLERDLAWFGDPHLVEREVWADRLQSLERRAAAPEDSLGAHVDLYLKHLEQRADNGDLSVGHVYSRRLQLSQFRDWIGKDTAVREIDGPTLLKYHTHLMDKVKTKEWTRTTARHYLVAVKAFVRWLWQSEAIPALPRMLDSQSKLLTISDPLPTVVVFTPEEVRTLLAAASDRTKLYVLLMLNCGMTQKDIADLKPSEIDWQAGRIIRKRSKTRDCDTVPEVNYLLWPETLRLLQQERSDSTERVLLNSSGEPIWQENLGAAAKYQKNDNVKNAFDRLRKKVGVAKPLKSLKKTSATLLRGNEKFQGLQGVFLGHAPQSMSDRHYTQVPQGLLDQALTWLAAQYGIGTGDSGVF